MPKVILKSLFVWICFIPIPIINGAIRGLILVPYFGEIVGRQISTAILSIVFVVFVFAFMKNQFVGIRNRNLIFIGLFWLLLTVSFELGFGYFVEQLTIENMFVDYNLLEGKVWILFLIIVFFTPILIKFMKNIKYRKGIT